METDDTFELRVTPLCKDPELFGRRATDLLLNWDGTTDGPEYQELIMRLKDWTTKAINRASAIRDIG